MGAIGQEVASQDSDAVGEPIAEGIVRFCGNQRIDYARLGPVGPLHSAKGQVSLEFFFGWLFRKSSGGGLEGPL